MAHSRSVGEITLNALALVGVLVINTLANVLPIGGQTTGSVSDNFPSTFTPAGYVFSIWGVIYLLLFAFVIWQALPKQRDNQLVHNISTPFLVTCLANISWIFAWHYNQVVLSFVLMLILFAALIQIYRLLADDTRTTTSYWFVRLPFSVYTGWITVATLANLSALQLHFGWQDLPIAEAHMTILKIAVAATVGVTLLFLKRDVAFALVVVWACIGVAVANNPYPLVQGAASGVAVLGLLIVIVERILSVARQRSTA